jgi:hypothetical protein
VLSGGEAGRESAPLFFDCAGMTDHMSTTRTALVVAILFAK